MRFDNSSRVGDVLWGLRLADLPRGEDRAKIQRQFNGSPPFDEDKAKENNIQVNRNFLEGVNLMSQARRQWCQAFLKPGNYFSATLDSGDRTKRSEWSHSITRNSNRVLKRERLMMEQARATGGNVMLFGPGPTTWDSRRSVIPTPLPISSLMIPSETGIDFENLAYFAVFREWTPAQLYGMTHGPRVDPGWNMPLVQSQLRYVASQTQKEANATAYQYMPERIEELIKQDGGYWGSDAVPTVDVWDFYFREDEDGKGWYRRTVLDWGVAEGINKSSSKPAYGNPDAEGQFLYTSGKRKYANKLSEILHCNCGDTSAVFPQKYHSMRSLGWMLWGVVELQNRLSCKFTESVFQQLMWFFQVASDSDMKRLQVAQFAHMGVIPPGVKWVTAQERFKPDQQLLNMAFSRNRQIMSENAAAFTQDFDRGAASKEMTATETMARVNSVNALVSGMLTLAYTYETYKYREICRRLCLPHSTNRLAAEFRKLCLCDGVPEQLLDADRWDIEPERVLGAGNKTLEIAQAQFLQSLRPHLGPEAQRAVDHIAIEANTDDPALAERLAPVQGQKDITDSMHDAQLSTERLMSGLPFVARPDMIYEDYVKVWLADLGFMVNRDLQSGGMSTAQNILGYQNMAQQIGQFIAILAQDKEQKAKVKMYNDTLAKIMNEVKAFAQRLQQHLQAGNGANGNGGVDPKDAAKIAGEQAKAAAKVQMMQTSHAQRTAQRQVQFDLAQRREDAKTQAEIQREHAKAAAELLRVRMQTFQE